MRLLPLLVALCACGDTLRAAKSTDDTASETLDADSDGSPAAEDCDDDNAAVYPGATEICNGIDDDCDFRVDAQDDSLTDGQPGFADADGDTFGDPDAPTQSCGDDSGVVADATDCDDRNPAVHPGAAEACATPADDDCDGDTNDPGADGCHDFYADADGDTFGGESSACLCLPSDEYPALAPQDCLDSDPAVNPDGTELCANGLDDDCDGSPGPCVYAGNTSLSEANARVYADTTLLRLGDAVDSRDLNGDGIGELLVFASGGTGLVSLFKGPFTGTHPTTDGAWRNGDAIAPLTHAALTESLDGDALGDVILGMAAADSGQGALYLWSGDAAEAPTVRISGPTSGALSTARSVGDVNGDGKADLVALAPGRDLFYILPGPLTSGVAASLGTEVRGAGGALADLAGLGDTNGDGIDDFAVGAPERGAMGRVWLIEGPAALTTTTDATAELNATVTDALFGARLCAPGDANGDGYADLFIGAPGMDAGDGATGAAYLFHGPLTGALDETAAVAAFLGEYARDGAGTALGCGGDLNADGAVDFAIGAPAMDQVASGAGMTYLTYGPVSGTIALKLTDAFFEGRERLESNGTALSLSTDLGGEGYADLVIGAPGRSDLADDAGAVEVFFGLGI